MNFERKIVGFNVFTIKIYNCFQCLKIKTKFKYIENSPLKLAG